MSDNIKNKSGGRNIKDASLIKEIALPSSAGSANTASVDVKGTGDLIERVGVNVKCDSDIVIPVGSSVTLTLQASEDDTTYTDLATRIVNSATQTSVASAASVAS